MDDSLRDYDRARRPRPGVREVFLFSIQDTPVFEALGLYREEASEENGGHQPISRVFRE
jgi:hypothetical protein